MKISEVKELTDLTRKKVEILEFIIHDMHLEKWCISDIQIHNDLSVTLNSFNLDNGQGEHIIPSSFIHDFTIREIHGDVKLTQWDTISDLNLMNHAGGHGSQYRVIACDGLTSLLGAPREVEGNFILQNNSNLHNFIGGPKEVGRHFMVDSMSIESYKGAPHVAHVVDISSTEFGPGAFDNIKIPTRCRILKLDNCFYDGYRITRDNIGKTGILDAIKFGNIFYDSDDE